MVRKSGIRFSDKIMLWRNGKYRDDA